MSGVPALNTKQTDVYTWANGLVKMPLPCAPTVIGVMNVLLKINS